MSAETSIKASFVAEIDADELALRLMQIGIGMTGSDRNQRNKSPQRRRADLAESAWSLAFPSA